MGIIGSRAQPSQLSDSELIARSRSGDRDAFGELWRRHSRAGVTVARSYTSTFDPDDLVAESYAKIFQAIQSGGGPTGAFRPYLFTTIRNTAATWGRAKRETAIEDVEQFEDPNFSEENTLAALDRSLTATAFRSLPTRWQEALWYSEVESMTPQEIAPLLGMKANAVAALTYRAREGLRQAWIQAHLSSLPTDSECRWSIDHLGAYARHGLSKRDTARIDEHLADCAKCTIVAAEAKEVGSRLALVLLPLAAGLAGATGYAAWLQSGAHAAAYALGVGGVVTPAAAVGGGAAGGTGAGGAGAGTGAGTGAGAGAAATAATTAGAGGVVVGAVVTGLLVAAAAVTAIVVAPMVFDKPDAHHSDASAPPAATSDPAPATPAPSLQPPAAPPATAPPATQAAAASDSSSTGAPVTVPPSSSPPAETPAPPAPSAPSAPSIGTASVSPAGLLTLAGAGDPGNMVVATAQSVAGGGGGTARFAVVPAALEVGRASVGDSGAWSITADLSSILPNGTYTFTVVQSGPAGASDPATTQPISLRVAPEAPVISTVDTGGDGRYLPIVSGTASAGATVEVSNGSEPGVQVVAGADGAWTTEPLDGFVVGHNTVTAVVIDESAGTSPTVAKSFALIAPQLFVEGTGFGNSASGSGPSFSVHLSDGVAGVDVDLLADGNSFTGGDNPSAYPRLDESGTSDTNWVWAGAAPGSTHSIGARYVGDGRYGAESTTKLVLDTRGQRQPTDRFTPARAGASVPREAR